MKKSILIIAVLISFAGFSQTNKQKIQTHLNANLSKFGLTGDDVSDWVIESEVPSEGTKITSYYIVQRYQGIEIFNAQSNVSVKDGKVINVGNKFKKDIAKKVNATVPVLSVIDAITSVYSRLGIKSPTSFSIAETINGKAFKLSDGIQEETISAKLVYQPTKDNKLKLAWAFQFYSPDGKYLWDIRIDALNGVVLEKKDLTVRCSFGHSDKENHKSSGAFWFEKNTFQNTAVSPVQVAAGSYRVIPYNYESPNHHTFDLITSPSNALASPNGWHNTNAIGGSTPTLIYNYTRGNNVLAQEDALGDNGNGIRPDGGSGFNFDFAYAGQTVQPAVYTPAATTNLFYMINIMHDVWYQYGFNEISGNFQQHNLGRGGSNADYVLADSQDGYDQASATLNNANFTTPVDGIKPRMQMFMWTLGAPPTNFITVNSPAAIAGPKLATSNVFEGTDRIPVPASPNGITANLVLYKNNPTPPGYNSACQTPTNAAELNGKIALIKRGGCLFNFKVKNAQLAGAIGVIVMDSIANNPQRMQMSSTGILGITIPAVFVTKEIGDSFIAELANGVVNVKLESPPNLYLYADGDFDNGIIAHEFAHGISNRLTGGPANSNCLEAPEQMGEGWSDWAALMMQIKTGDVGTTAKPLGNYVINQSNTGGGIRNYPYSTDMSINPLTFDDTNGKTFIYTDDAGIETELVEPHNTGEVWAAMLWDLTWAYIGKYGLNTNIYTGTGGNNKVMRLVLDAMKLQPCNPSYIEARDAIIDADQATTGGKDYCLIWKVFARRGLGVNANSGDNSGDATNITGISDQVEDFTEPSAGANCTLGVNNFNKEKLIRVYPNATSGLIHINIENFTGKVNLQVVDMTGRLVFNITDDNFNGEKSIDLSHFQKGIYIIKVSNETTNYTEKIIIK